MGLRAKCRMTWEPRKSRWRKMRRGKIYTISCQELGTENTKEASYQAANAWWLTKLATLTLHPHQGRLDELARRKDWAERHGELDAAKAIAGQIGEVTVLDERDDPPPDYPRQRIAGAQLLGAVPDDLDPILADALFGDRRIWEERFRRDSGRPSDPAIPTVGELARQWESSEQTKVVTGQLKPRSFANKQASLAHFVSFVGGELAPVTITETTIQGYHVHLVTLVGPGPDQRSPSNAKDRFKVAVQFVRWLYEHRHLELPRNLARPFRFGDTPPVIVPMSDDEVGRLVGTATGQTRLHILLMMNCGMGPSDIAALWDDEVDWTAGRVTRKRSKTRTHKAVPIVDYPLWPETFALLKAHRSGGPIVLLTSRTGLPWIRESVSPDGGLHSSNTLQSNLEYLWKKAKVTTSSKHIRKAGASWLKTHPDHAQFHDLYLGHAPHSMADRHYSQVHQAGFDRAIQWLGEHWGLASPSV